jgi:hypothetical protein
MGGRVTSSTSPIPSATASAAIISKNVLPNMGRDASHFTSG